MGWIDRSGSGYGYGYGYGYGDGSGYGYGYGDGYGYGYGYGYDYGDVALSGHHVEIGCQRHTIAEWLGETGQRLATEHHIPKVVQSCLRALLESRL